MSLFFNTRKDGSSVLFIDGDLQFDTRDEAIYHESLVFPALSVLQKRRPGQADFRGLILGGGDGLVARDMLKTNCFKSIVVAEYDASVIALTRTKLAVLSNESFADPRVDLQIGDCQNFIDYAIADGAKFDIVIADLTVPQSLSAASLHCIDFYKKIVSILKNDAVFATNALSPTKYPDAYWSIYNSMRCAEFFPRPYRIAIPSFQAEGYGPDWGFFLASPAQIDKSEIGIDFVFPASNTQLKNAEQMQRLFHFPAFIAARRELSLPAGAGSDILLHYLSKANDENVAYQTDWNSLDFSIDNTPIPRVDLGDQVLPHDVCTLLKESIDKDTVFEQIIDLMPSLQRDQTKEMVGAFLLNPGRFLQAIDLPALVDRLIARAEELPRKLLAELKELKIKLEELAGDYERLLQLGLKVVTIATLVVIVGNLLSPDAVYGKGSPGGGTYGTFASDSHGFSQLSHTKMDVSSAEPELATGSGFRSRQASSMCLDETGTAYPARTYRYYYGGYGNRYYFYGRRHYASAEKREADEARRRLKTSHGVFKLSPEADVLEDGQVVIQLTDAAYLFLDSEATTVVDSQTGEPIMDLSADPAQLWRISKELTRQKTGIVNSLAAKQEWINWVDWLGFMPWRDDDLTEMKNLFDMSDRLSSAQKKLNVDSSTPPPLFTPPVANAIEVINTIWLVPNGKSVFVWLPENKFAYMNGSNWYSDPQLTKPLTNPAFSPKFCSVVKGLLLKENKEQNSTKQSLMRDLNYAQADMTSLQRDKSDYRACSSDTQMYEMVDYGSTQIPLGQAITRTDNDITATAQRIKMLQDQVEALPQEAALRAQILEQFKN
jgi:spermidine synthase